MNQPTIMVQDNVSAQIQRLNAYGQRELFAPIVAAFVDEIGGSRDLMTIKGDVGYVVLEPSAKLTDLLAALAAADACIGRV